MFNNFFHPKKEVPSPSEPEIKPGDTVVDSLGVHHKFEKYNEQSGFATIEDGNGIKREVLGHSIHKENLTQQEKKSDK